MAARVVPFRDWTVSLRLCVRRSVQLQHQQGAVVVAEAVVGPGPSDSFAEGIGIPGPRSGGAFALLFSAEEPCDHGVGGQQKGVAGLPVSGHGLVVVG